MKNNSDSKIKFFLYNYNNTELLIKEKEEEIIDGVNISGKAWMKGKYKSSKSNSLENQVIRLIYEKNKIKRWHLLNSKVFIFLRKKKPMKFRFVKLKYLDKKSEEEIEKIMKTDSEAQKIIDGQVIHLIEINARNRNLI